MGAAEDAWAPQASPFSRSSVSLSLPLLGAPERLSASSPGAQNLMDVCQRDVLCILPQAPGAKLHNKNRTFTAIV